MVYRSTCVINQNDRDFKLNFSLAFVGSVWENRMSKKQLRGASLKPLRRFFSQMFFGWRMVGLVSAMRVLGGGLHNYGFTVFFSR